MILPFITHDTVKERAVKNNEGEKRHDKAKQQAYIALGLSVPEKVGQLYRDEFHWLVDWQKSRRLQAPFAPNLEQAFIA